MNSDKAADSAAGRVEDANQSLLRVRWYRMAHNQPASDSEVDLLAGMTVLSELGTLLSCTLMSRPPDNEPCDVTQRAQTCQMFYFLLLLVGKAQEAWKFLDASFPRRAQREITVQRELGEEALDAYKKLKQIFGDDRSNIIKVRNEVVFHYDRVSLKRALDLLDWDDEFEVWIARAIGATRCNIGTVLAIAQIRHCLGGNCDLDEFFDQAIDAVSQLQRFFSEWVVCRFEKHVHGLRTTVTQEDRPPARIPALVLPRDIGRQNAARDSALDGMKDADTLRG